MSASRLSAAVLAALVLTGAGTARAQNTGYRMSQSAATFVSIAGQGTTVSLSSSDDGSGEVPMPFPIVFGGQTASTLSVGSNGIVVVNDSTNASSLSNDVMPSSTAPNGVIAAFWQDMYAVGSVYYAVSGTTGRRVLTIEWDDIGPYISSYRNTDLLSVQVKFAEADGTVSIHYGPRMNTGGASWASGSIGIENLDGTAGAAPPCTPGCSYDDVPDGTVLVFTPSAGPVAGVDLVPLASGSLPSVVQPGATVTIDVELNNRGTTTSGGCSVALVIGPTNPVGVGTGLELGRAGFGPIPAGGLDYETIVASIPATGLPPGVTVYAALIADIDAQVSETDEANNVQQLGPVTLDGGTPMGSITISTRTLPAGRSGDPYEQRLSASGAPSPSWSVASGRLPAGLQLDAMSGTLSGVPAEDGQFGFRVQASQSGYTPGTADLVLTIQPAGGLRLETTQLPEARVGEPYTANLRASGGQAPYAFQAVAGLPGWLSITGDGSASGTPSGPGEHTIEVSIFDSNGAFASGSAVLVVVQPGPLQLVTTAAEVPAGQTGVFYEFEFRAAGGRRPYAFGASGSLPPGLSLDSETGLLSGTPSETGSFSFQVVVVDGEESQATLAVTVRVTERVALRITLPSRIQVAFNAAANVALTAEGGTPPYSWQVVGGSLPPGLSVVGAAITGVATASVSATVVLGVSDSAGASETAEIEVTARSGGGGGGGGTSSGGGRRGSSGTTRRTGGCVCVERPVNGPDLASSTAGLLLIGLALARGGWRQRRILLLKGRGRS